MITTSLHPAMIALALLCVIIMFIGNYARSDREILDRVFCGLSVIVWSALFIRFIFEQWL